MRKKTALITVVLIIAGGAIVTYWQFTKQEKQTNPVPNQTLSQTTAAISKRSSFEPYASPDGKLMLQIIPPLSGGANENELILRDLITQNETVLLKSKEYIHPAGWSSDGKKVYYLSRPESDGCGGAYPAQTYAGTTLHEVDIATKKVKTILQAKGSGCASFYGIHDVYAAKNMVLFEEPVGSTDNFTYNIYTSDLTGKNKKLITTIPGTDGITANTISPDGTRIALVTNYNTEGAEYNYTIVIVDIASGSKRTLNSLNSSTNIFNGWADNNTLNVSSSNTTRNVEIQ